MGGSRRPGTNSLWLLPSGPDQVGDSAVRRLPWAHMALIAAFDKRSAAHPVGRTRRNADAKAVHGFGQDDLTGEPRSPRRMRGEVEQVLLLLSRGGQLLEVLGVHDHMAGRAGHNAFAGTFERLARRPGDVEQALSGFGLDFLVQAPVGPEESHQGHASSFSWATAAAAMRLHASTSSVCVV